MKSPCLIFAIVLLNVGSPFVCSQPPQPRVARPDYTELDWPTNLNELLRERLARSKEYDQFKDVFEKLKQSFPKEFRQAQAELQNNPEFMKQIQKWVESIPPDQLKVTAEQLQKLRELHMKSGIEPVPMLNLGKPPEDFPPIEGKTPSTQAQFPQIEPQADDPLRELLLELLEDIKDRPWAQGFADSESFQELLRDLSRTMDWNPNARGGQSPLNKLPWLPKKLPRFSDSGFGVDFLKKLPTPQLPQWRLPAFELRGFNISLPRLPRISPRFGAFGSPSGVSIIWIIVWTIGLGMLWWIFSRALGRSPFALLFGPAKSPSTSRRTLGEVPRTLETRGDVIRAFEILAQRQLGDEVRTWNHRAVAKAWNSDAGAVLARLYESARYTPGDAPLPPDDRARAERALAQLQGGVA